MDLASGDDAVAATNDDASMCKYQAVQKGYYRDEFLGQILSTKLKSTSSRKAPEINRGYYARSAAIATLVEQFIESFPSSQVLSLGAGYDSLYWRLKSKQQSHGTQEFRFVEIDMSPVVMHKMMAIRRHPKLESMLTNSHTKREGLHSDSYHMISFDLRQVDKSSLKQRLIEDCQIDFAKPTLCLLECVLVYMPIPDSESLIRWLGSNFGHLSMINYEQCNMNDRFGEIMLANMTDRHCDLMGVAACKSLDTQMARFKSAGLENTKAYTMSQIYKTILAPNEIERIERIEFLDEKELLEQLLDHYCVVIGSNCNLDWIPEEKFWLAKSIA